MNDRLQAAFQAMRRERGRRVLRDALFCFVVLCVQTFLLLSLTGIGITLIFAGLIIFLILDYALMAVRINKGWYGTREEEVIEFDLWAYSHKDKL